jgi:hypothetical protein
MRGSGRAVRGAAAAAVVVLLLGAGSAIALPKRFVPVDSGRFAGTDWELAMGATGEERCYRLTMEGRGGWSQAKVCDQGIPQWHLWELEFGSSDGSAMASVSISGPQVHRVNLLMAYPGSGRKPNWHSFRMRMLTEAQAKRANLKRDFRYAVLTGFGDFCVKQVNALDRLGRLLEKRKTVCEY